jgi:hypothetical protein
VMLIAVVSAMRAILTRRAVVNWREIRREPAGGCIRAAAG